MRASSLIRWPRLSLTVSVIVIASAVSGQAQQSISHDFLTIGKKSGEQVLTRNSDGKNTIHFSFNDRGRGPETVTRYSLDDHGLPLEVSITGLNYIKSEISENYTRHGNQGSWRSDNEQGKSDRVGLTTLIRQ